IASDDDYCSIQSEVQFQCSIGSTYYIHWTNWYAPEEYDWLLEEIPMPTEGLICANAILLTLPVVDLIGTTQLYGDDYDNTMACASSYMNGDDIVYEFTLAQDGFISGDLTSPESWIGMFILDGCPDAGANCIVTSTSTGSFTSFIDEPITAGTYFVVVSSWPSPQFIDFIMNLSFRLINTETDILTYSFPEETGVKTIDNVAHTVALEVSQTAALTALIADFTLSDFATADIGATPQVSGVTANDFTGAVTYTITAEDLTTQDWTVTVTNAVALSSENDFLAYSFPEETGPATIIGTPTYTIDIEVAWDADVTNLIADFVSSPLSTVDIGVVPQTSGLTSNDFTSAVTYTITAEDGITIQDWVVTVSLEPAPQGALCGNPISLTLPVVDLMGTTEGFGDDYDDPSVCYDWYLDGDDI
ncbi:unnamed protein product, partial [marine sediment metagenome]